MRLETESAIARARPAMRRLRRPGRIAAGILMLIVGAIVAPTPIPVGLVLMLAGLTLLVAESRMMREATRALRRRLPGLSRSMARVRHRVPAPLGHVIDATDPEPPKPGARCPDAPG